jgi:hypothetical protein
MRTKPIAAKRATALDLQYWRVKPWGGMRRAMQHAQQRPGAGTQKAQAKRQSPRTLRRLAGLPF